MRRCRRSCLSHSAVVCNRMGRVEVPLPARLHPSVYAVECGQQLIVEPPNLLSVAVLQGPACSNPVGLGHRLQSRRHPFRR